MTDWEVFEGKDTWDDEYTVKVSSVGEAVVLRYKGASILNLNLEQVDELVTALLYFKQKVVDNENRAAQS